MSGNCIGVSISNVSKYSAPTVTSNTLTSCDTGLRVNHSNGTYTGNTISGNTSYGLYNGGTTTIDATNNYWGDPSGPLDDSDDRASGGYYNPNGKGNRVSDYVNYDPWTGKGATNPVIPSPPTTGTVGGNITIDGMYFGATQGSGYVDFNGVHGKIVSWSDTQIVVTIPAGATSGCLTIVTNYGTSDCINFTVIAKSDFNADGKTDFIWQNTTSGQVYYWLMDGLNLSSSGYLYDGIPVGLEWRIDGIGDLNADGKSDLIWRNTSTGQIYYWLMDGLNLSSSGYLYDGQVLDLQWQIAGVSDLNSDGKPDLIWRNTSNGTLYYWLMDGLTLSSSGYLYDGNPVGLEWRIDGVYSLYDETLLFWRNTSTGQVYWWVIYDLTLYVSDYLYGGQAVDPQWQLAGVAYMNADGMPDLIWRNTSTGQVYYWLLDWDANISSSGYLYDGNPVGLEWQLRLK
jgi:hypothetical protein